MYNQNNNLYEPYQGFIRGNMFRYLYDNYEKIYDVKPINEQAELLTYLDMFDFACIDLGLYLDIYPNDEQILQLYNQLNNEKSKVLNKYEENYGPISLGSGTLNVIPWAWDDYPWPWEV